MRRYLLLMALILSMLPGAIWAQDTANIVGTVTDQTGAVIPNAKVTVRNAEKAFVRNAVTGNAGEFSAYAIPIGSYEVIAEAPGFKTITRTGFVLTVGQTQRVDFKMEVGQVTEQVTIEANLPQVQTENATISDVVVSRQIQQTNLNGRNWVTLATLVAGANPGGDLDTTHVGVYGNNNISFNGNRTQYNNWEIDGGPNTDEGSAGTFNTYPSIETIAEFRVSTSNYGAELGRHSGATIELATKSGTTEFHGSMWEFLRNDKLDAQDWSLNRQGSTEKRPLKWNDFGYTVGGPAYIPGVFNKGKDKTFFFWSQGWRKYREGTIVSGDAPTARMREGDFSECDKSSPNYNDIIAEGCTVPEFNGTKFTDITKAPMFNQQYFRNTQALLDGLVPLPNNGPTGYLNATSTATNWRQEQIRVDQKITDRMQAFVRYTQDTWDTVTPTTLWGWSSFDTIKTPFQGPGKSAVAHLTNTFKPNLVNEFIMGYTVDKILLYNQAGGSSTGLDRPADFVMNHLFSANDNNPLLPGLAICGGTPFCFYEAAGNHPWFNSNPIFTWKDNIAWTKGKHTLKMGFFLEKYRKNEQFGADTQGSVEFWSGGPEGFSSGNAMADAFLGRISDYWEGSLVIDGNPVGGYPKGHWRMTDFEPYFQDDWKVTPRLTLNLGVRYYFFTRIHDVSNPSIDSGFIPSLYDASKQARLDADGNIIQDSGYWYKNYGNGLVKCGEGGIPIGCQERNTAKNFAPRFGFAYDVTGKSKTVIRGGWGLYYEAGNGNEAQTEGGEGNPPSAFQVTGYNLMGYDKITPGALGPSGYTAIPYKQGWPTLYQFNLSVQHQFSQDDIVQVAYVGSQGRHLARARNINQVPYNAGIMNVPELAGSSDYCDAQGNCDVQNALIHQTNPSIFFTPYRGYNNITVKENMSSSNYNSLQTSYKHSFKHGLSLQTAYTWSHNIDDSTSAYNGSPNNGMDDHNISRWKASSDLDRRHVVQMNYVYDLPLFAKSSNSVLKQALGGWQISGISTFMTGQPVNISCGVNDYSTGLGTGTTCNTVGDLKVSKSMYNDPTFGPTVRWFDPSVLTQPTEDQLYANQQPGMFGYLGRNVLTGPGRNNWSLALMKNFSLGSEKRTLQFRFETYNTFNHTQWSGFDAGCNGSPNEDGTPAFGRSCGGDAYNKGNGTVNGAHDPRIMQLGLKFSF